MYASTSKLAVAMHKDARKLNAKAHAPRLGLKASSVWDGEDLTELMFSDIEWELEQVKARAYGRAA